MKLTKEHLKTLIQEELENMDIDLEEADAPLQLKRAEAGKRMRQRSTEHAGGITDEEHHVIDSLTAKLTDFAKKGNAMMGPVAVKLQKLVTAIDTASAATGGTATPKRGTVKPEGPAGPPLP